MMTMMMKKEEKGWSSFSQKSTPKKEEKIHVKLCCFFVPLCATYFLQLDNKITPNTGGKGSRSLFPRTPTPSLALTHFFGQIRLINI